MRIAEIETFVLKVPLEDGSSFWSSQCSFRFRKSLLIRITTDTALSGWGECGQSGPAEPVAAMVHSAFAPILVGQDPRSVEVHWERMFSAIRDFGHSGAALEAISGIDIALWDLLGKSLGVPVYTLHGGAYRDAVRVYATGLYYAGARLPELDQELRSVQSEAARYRDAGFPAVKMKLGLLPLHEDMQRLSAIRTTLGDGCLLMADANHAYQAHVAARAAIEMEKYGVWWFEEPVAPEDIDGYLQVKAATNIAIAGGECEHTRFGFRKWFERRAIDIAQPDPCCAGGLTELRRIATLASTFHVQCIPHVWGSGVAIAAGLQFAATLQPSPHTANPISPYNEPLVEWDSSPNPLRQQILRTPFTLHDGAVAIPTAPGLGIEVDTDVVSRLCNANAVSFFNSGVISTYQRTAEHTELESVS